MKQPEGFAAKGQEHLVCKLKRSIYGLKQSPRCWNSALDCHLKRMGFLQTVSDPCDTMYQGMLLAAPLRGMCRSLAAAPRKGLVRIFLHNDVT